MPHALIVDDDANNLKVLGKMLSMAGFTHTAVQDTTQVSEALKTMGQIDIVFLDLEMPNLNGYDLLNYLKGEKGVTAPIVACTVHTNAINDVRAAGFDSFIGKPLRVEKFPNQLNQILNGEGVWDMGNRVG